MRRPVRPKVKMGIMARGDVQFRVQMENEKNFVAFSGKRRRTLAVAAAVVVFLGAYFLIRRHSGPVEQPQAEKAESHSSPGLIVATPHDTYRHRSTKPSK